MGTDGELFGDIRIGKKIGSLMVQCLYALEDFSFADFEDFTEYLQDISLDEDTTDLFKVCQIPSKIFNQRRLRHMAIQILELVNCLKIRIPRNKLFPRVLRYMFQ